MKIKEIWASMFIPKNTPYCHHRFKEDKKGRVCAKPCKYWCYKKNKKYNCQMEYCKYLKCFLDIQDQIKECGINEYKFND